MELLEELWNKVQKQDQMIESMYQENQYLRETVSSLTEVRQLILCTSSS
jgi:hypothetical protein